MLQTGDRDIFVVPRIASAVKYSIIFALIFFCAKKESIDVDENSIDSFLHSIENDGDRVGN
jgi:hypothetical protein